MRWFALDVAWWFRKYSGVLDFTGVVGEAGECGCWQDMGRSWRGARAIQRCRLDGRKDARGWRKARRFLLLLLPVVHRSAADGLLVLTGRVETCCACCRSRLPTGCDRMCGMKRRAGRRSGERGAAPAGLSEGQCGREDE